MTSSVIFESTTSKLNVFLTAAQFLKKFKGKISESNAGKHIKVSLSLTSSSHGSGDEGSVTKREFSRNYCNGMVHVFRCSSYKSYSYCGCRVWRKAGKKESVYRVRICTHHNTKKVKTEKKRTEEIVIEEDELIGNKHKMVDDDDDDFYNYLQARKKNQTQDSLDLKKALSSILLFGFLPNHSSTKGKTFCKIFGVNIPDLTLLLRSSNNSKLNQSFGFAFGNQTLGYVKAPTIVEVASGKDEKSALLDELVYHSSKTGKVEDQKKFKTHIDAVKSSNPATFGTIVLKTPPFPNPALVDVYLYKLDDFTCNTKVMEQFEYHSSELQTLGKDGNKKKPQKDDDDEDEDDDKDEDFDEKLNSLLMYDDHQQIDDDSSVDPFLDPIFDEVDVFDDDYFDFHKFLKVLGFPTNDEGMYDLMKNEEKFVLSAKRLKKKVDVFGNGLLEYVSLKNLYLGERKFVHIKQTVQTLLKMGYNCHRSNHFHRNIVDYVKQIGDYEMYLLFRNAESSKIVPVQDRDLNRMMMRYVTLLKENSKKKIVDLEKKLQEKSEGQKQKRSQE